MIHKLHQKLALALTVIALLSGCGPEVWNWRDEVVLADGRTILVDRKVVFGGPRLPWEKNRLQSEYVLKFPSPDDARKRFEYRSIGGLAPGALFFKKGIPYVIGNPRNGGAFAYYGCPDPDLVVHKHVDGKWKRVELDEIPPDLKKRNLAGFTDEGAQAAEAGKQISAAQIAQWNARLPTRPSGKFAGTRRDEIVLPQDRKTINDCKAIGESEMTQQWKDDFKKRFVPAITE